MLTSYWLYKYLNCISGKSELILTDLAEYQFYKRYCSEKY